MSLFCDVCYFCALLVAWPFILAKSLRTGKYRSDWAARFGWVPEEQRPARAPGKRLLIHCVSVGELLSIRQLVDLLLADDPTLTVLITTTTDTGTTRAREVYRTLGYRGRVETYRYPLDFSFAVERFFDAVRPDAIALVELETWPNFVRIAHGRRIPTCVINGRLTERAAKRYALIRPLVAGMFRRLSWLGVQTPTIAERFVQLGAPAERLFTLPTIKYDATDLSDTIPHADKMAAALGILPPPPPHPASAQPGVPTNGHLLLVGGATGPGEEIPLLEAYLELRAAYPNLRLAIVPRKPETLPQVLAAIQAAARGTLQAVRRTEHPDTQPLAAPLTSDQIIVIDTIGELKKLYSVAFGAFAGRSLLNDPPLGGSDMIEIAALAKPCCFGPHTFNFAEAVELLLSAQAAVVVADGTKLKETFRQWLSDPVAARQMGAKAREVIAKQRGSTRQYADRLHVLLNPPKN